MSDDVRQLLLALDHGQVSPSDPEVRARLRAWLEDEEVVRRYPYLLAWAKQVYDDPVTVCRLVLRYRTVVVDVPLDWRSFCPESCFECVRMALAELGDVYPESALEKSPALTDPVMEPFWRDLAAFPGRWATLPWRLRDWAPTFARPSRNATGRFIELKNGEARVVPEDAPPSDRPPKDTPGIRFDGETTYLAVPDWEETGGKEFYAFLDKVKQYAPTVDIPLRLAGPRPRFLEHVTSRLRHANFVLTPATIVGREIKVYSLDDLTLHELSDGWYVARDRIYVSNDPEPYQLDVARASLQPSVPVSVMVCRELRGSKAVRIYRVEAVVTEGTRQVIARTPEAKARALAHVQRLLVSRVFYV